MRCIVPRGDAIIEETGLGERRPHAVGSFASLCQAGWLFYVEWIAAAVVDAAFFLGMPLFFLFDGLFDWAARFLCGGM